MIKLLKVFTALLILVGGINSTVDAETLESVLRPSEDAIEYPDSYLNKYAEETSEEHIYDITLEVTGKSFLESEIDVIFVLDESGSMAGEKIEILKDAMKDLTYKMLDHGGFNIGIVNYSTRVNSELDFTQTYTEIETFIDTEVNALGGTFTQGGLIRATEMMESRPEEREKKIILVSDGVPTSSRRVTSIAPIEDDEVRPYGSFTPTYKVTGYDDVLQAGDGKNYAIYGNSSFDNVVDNVIIRDNGESTIGSTFEFKDRNKATIYSLGVEIHDNQELTYRYDKNSANFPTDSWMQSIVFTWDEEVRDGVISPNETVSFTAEYTNETGAVIEEFYFRYLYVTDHWYSTFRNKLRDPSGTCVTVSIDDVVQNTYTCDELNNLSETNASVVTGFKAIDLPVDSVYKVELEFEMGDFDLEDAPIRRYEHGTWVSKIRYTGGSHSTTRIGSYITPQINFPRYSTNNLHNQGEYVLRNISSNGIEGNTYFDVEDKMDLYDTMVEVLYEELVSSIVDGRIDDPMGADYISFIPSAMASGQDFEVWATKDNVSTPTLLDTVTVSFDETTNNVIIEGLNLGRGETAYIKYKVRLETEEEGFEFNKLYPTNGTAKLTAKEGGEQRAFPDPLVVAVEEETLVPTGMINYTIYLLLLFLIFLIRKIVISKVD